MKFEIKRVQKTKTRTLFVPLINGKRITKTLFARKYDAQNLIDRVQKSPHLLEKFN